MGWAVFTAPLGYCSFILQEDSRLFAFGGNSNYQLGLGHSTNQASPQEVEWGGPPILQLSGGRCYSLILDILGSVWLSGKIGDHPEQLLFTKVEGLPPVQFISCGYDHAIAVDEQGIVWTIPGSSNTHGELGLRHAQPSPAAQAVTVFSPAKKVACGTSFTVVEVHDGSLWATGNNIHSERTAGEAVNLPRQIAGSEALKYPLRSLSAGGAFFVAVDYQGSIWTCGISMFGQLGRPKGDTLARVEDVPPMLTVAAGQYHCLGVSEDLDAWAWGDNDYGQVIGRGQKSRPQLIPLPGGAKVEEIRASFRSSFTITPDGDVFVVGNNNFGQLGLEDWTSRSTWTAHPLKPDRLGKSRAKSARSILELDK